MAVDLLGDARALVSNQMGDVLDAQSGCGQDRHERVPQLTRRPLLRIDSPGRFNHQDAPPGIGPKARLPQGHWYGERAVKGHWYRTLCDDCIEHRFTAGGGRRYEPVPLRNESE